MPSIVENFEYDIFISYRLNDNRSGWVTEFVNNLRDELASVVKDPITVYFDSNLYDGLLETHDVDKSLEGKLKSVLFIPILSQIYCDPKSFAWQNEFCAFNSAAKADAVGREVILRNGNVTSRILPIIIHNLEQEDLELIEKEIKAKLRSIDFTFRAPGINRPLRKEDKRSDNVNNLAYHDQLNKLAHAAKEIIMSVKNHGKFSSTPHDVLILKDAKEVVDITNEKSLAVLPFHNISNDPSQEYFADGISENILAQLASLPHFRVISRNSIVRYKHSAKSTPEIASELGIKFIVEGSVQHHKDKIRISVQLVDAIHDQHLWSKVFTEKTDDIFELQNKVAEEVANELKTSLSPQQNNDSQEAPTKDLEAYDLFLKGRHAFNQWNVDGYRMASEYFKKAIARDPDFKEAYSYLASSYSARMSWNGDLAPDEALKSISVNLAEAWKRGPTDNDYLTRAFVEFFIAKDFEAAERLLLQAKEINSKNTNVLYCYCYLLNILGRFEEAMAVLNETKEIDPLTIGYFNYKTLCFYFLKKYDEALLTLEEGIRLYPSVLRLRDFKARVFLTLDRPQDTIDTINAALQLSRARQPSMLAYLAIAYFKKNEMEKSNELVEELARRSDANEKGINFYLALAHYAMNDETAAHEWLVKAKKSNDVDLIWLNVDPLLNNFSTESTSPDFEAAEKEIVLRLQSEMPKLEYHNIDHVMDVLASAMLISQHEKLNENEIKILRIAALMHDIGFIRSTKDHEQKGAEIAREILPAFGFTSSLVVTITQMILATKLPQSPVTHLEKILCDADLDYLGRDDYSQIAEKLYHEVKAQGVVTSEREWNLVQQTFLQTHQYHTHFGRSVREKVKQSRLREIVSILNPQ